MEGVCGKVKYLEQTSKNPIIDIIDENEELENAIYDAIEFIRKLTLELNQQRHYKKNEEFIYSNRLSKRFYHYRDEQNAPRITVCVISDPKSGMFHRGISICSQLDIVEKEEGRDIAQDRAISAMKNKEDHSEIIRGDVNNIVQSIYIKYSEISPKFFNYKSVYNADLTNYEKKLFKINTDANGE